MSTTISNIRSLLSNVVLAYIGWIVVHFICATFYPKLCVPPTIMGFLMSPIMNQLPHCAAMRWVIYNSGIAMNLMWVALGNWIILTILPQAFRRSIAICKGIGSQYIFNPISTSQTSYYNSEF